MHAQLSLLLILTYFSALFFSPGSASIPRQPPPPPPALTTTGTTSTSSDPPTTNALLPRGPEQQTAAPSLQCNCRLAVQWSDCLFYKILNWPREQNVITILHDELIKCGTKNFGLHQYYIPERESGLGAFAFFRLPHIHQDACWLKASSRALGTQVAACEVLLPRSNHPFPWWEDIFETRHVRSGIQYMKPPPDYTFPPR